MYNTGIRYKVLTGVIINDTSRRFKRLRTSVHNRRNRSGKAISQHTDGRGYFTSTLSMRNKPYKVLLHRAVVRSFIGEPDRGYVVAHKNGDKSDNRLSNLAIVLPYVNSQHMIEHGNSQKGEKHYKCKLSDEAVSFIRANADSMSRDYLSKLFSCSLSHLCGIILGVQRQQ